MDDRQRRILESIENLILHPTTPVNEKNAGINRWEHITGEKWTGKPKTRSSSSSSGASGQNRSNNRNTNDDWDEFWKKAGFGGFGFGGYDSGFYNRQGANNRQQHQSQQQQQKQQSKDNWSYDFGGGCTEKQWNYIKSISDFFRWKCPQRHEIEFEEAKQFLDMYADLFQMFNPRTRDFRSLKKLFETLGVDWSQTKRTFKWKAYGER